MKYLVGWPWLLAKWCFAPRVAEDPAIVRAAMTRTWIGFAVVGVVYFRYGSLSLDLLGAALLKLLGGIVLLVPCYLILVGLLVGLAPPARRRWTLRCMLRGPVLTLLGFIGVLALIYAMVNGTLAEVMRVLGDAGVFLSCGFALLVPFLALFGLASVYFASRYMFRAVDGHPLLPALTAPWLALAGTIVDILSPIESKVPPALSYALSFCGVASVLALSIWEYRRISLDLDITLRSGTPELARNEIPPWAPH